MSEMVLTLLESVRTYPCADVGRDEDSERLMQAVTQQLCDRLFVHAEELTVQVFDACQPEVSRFL